MKTFLKTVALIMVILFVLIGCDRTSSNDESNVDSSSLKATSGDILEDLKKQEKSDVFLRFEAGMNDIGIVWEELEAVASSMIGAEEGHRYWTENESISIELYLYAKDSEAFKKVIETNKMDVQGFGTFPAFANKESGLVLTILNINDMSDKMPQKEKVLTLLQSL